MRLDDLHCFAIVCEVGQLTLAARRLGYTQSALSKAMTRLEEEFALPLLERTARGVVPTVAGTQLRQHALAMLSHSQALQAEMAQHRNATSGQLHLGVLPSLTHALLAPLIARFLPTRPMARFRFESQLSAHLLEQLINGALDLAFIALPDLLPAGLSQHPLGPLHVSLVARANHPRLHQLRTLKDVAQERWALPEKGLFLRQWLNTRMQQQGLPALNVVVESDTAPTNFSSILRHSDLIGLAPTQQLHHSIWNGIAALEGKQLQWQHALGVVWRSHSLSPLAHEFRDEAIAWCSQRTF
ncbi:MAG: LysR family transcriptional regulator [Comamonas sp.]|nr:LysR family transcriptional regulator [Candidatus Comamonas equi]